MILKSVSIVGAVLASTILSSYQQNLCINSGLLVEKGVSIEEKVINKDYKYLKEDLKIPQLKGEESSKSIKVINESILNDIMPLISEGENVSQQYYKELNQMPDFSYEMIYNYTVDLDNEKILSLHSELYQFLGGAHGSTTRYSYTIDKENLNILKLKDLFKANYDYKTIINNEIRIQIQERLKEDPGMFFDEGNDFKGVTEESAYYLEKGNLVMYFQQYEIAPYAAGIIEFRIPISDFGDNYKF